MCTPRILMLLLLAGIVVVSAKPHRDPSYKAVNSVSVKNYRPERMVPGLRFDAAPLADPEGRLYNRRGEWYEGWGDTLSDWGNTIADHASYVGDTLTSWGNSIGDAVDDAKDELDDAFDKRAVNPVSIKDNIQEQMVPGLDFDAASLPKERLYNRRGGWFEGWGDTLSDWRDAIVDTASDVGDTLKSWGNTVGDAVDDARDELAGAFDKRAVNPAAVNIESINKQES